MRANRMKTVYSSSPSSSSFFDLFNKLFDMLNYLMDDVKALEVFPALEKIFFCSLQRFPLFHFEPCDFSRFSCKENAGCSEKSANSRASASKAEWKVGEKVFHLSVRFDTFIVSQVGEGKAWSDEFSSELKRKAGKDLWRRRKRFKLNLFSNYFHLNFSTVGGALK